MEIEIKDAKRVILMLFETLFLVLDSLIKYLFMPDTLHQKCIAFFRI